MDSHDIEAVVEKLRDAGESLGLLGGREIVLPTPDDPLRSTLEALCNGGRVTCKEAGRLIYYLGDMLEE